MAKVSNVRKSDQVIAILCSDIHLSHRAPIARSAEPDWYAAMQRPLDQLADLKARHDCPIICAGDVFDKWDSPAELINFALEYLPVIYAIPGQHDLPDHNLDDIKRSAYWTLVTAGEIENIEEPISICGFSLYPFPWGVDVSPPVLRPKNSINLAVVHSYIWTQGSSYPGAPKDKNVSKYIRRLEGYDAAVFGDNHQGFICSIGSEEGDHCSIMNCGTLMRRTSKELNYQPQVGLLLPSGSIRAVKLDCREDKWIDFDQALELVEQSLEITDFVVELAALGRKSVDFGTALKRFLTSNKIDSHVRKIILQAMEDRK